jgi:hypothetical protein
MICLLHDRKPPIIAAPLPRARNRGYSFVAGCPNPRFNCQRSNRNCPQSAIFPKGRNVTALPRASNHQKTPCNSQGAQEAQRAPLQKHANLPRFSQGAQGAQPFCALHKSPFRLTPPFSIYRFAARHQSPASTFQPADQAHFAFDVSFSSSTLRSPRSLRFICHYQFVP